MLGIEVQEGFGLGNQLFFYITTRCIAQDKGYEYSVLDPEHFANNMHSDCGLYFMDLDMGRPSKKEDYEKVFREKDTRLYAGNSKHDLTHGVYVTDTDRALFAVEDGTLLYGNLQAEDYFISHKEEIRKWLAVKPAYDCHEYSRDNLCVLHLRCSDYMGSPELFLRKKYWTMGMKQMRKINPAMEFMIITNDVKEAAGHKLWVQKKHENLGLYKEAKIYTVFVTTAEEIQDNTALFGEDICYLSREKLYNWAERVIGLLKQAYRTFTGEGDAVWREDIIKLFEEEGLTPEDYIEMIDKKHLKDL